MEQENDPTADASTGKINTISSYKAIVEDCFCMFGPSGNANEPHFSTMRPGDKVALFHAKKYPIKRERVRLLYKLALLIKERKQSKDPDSKKGFFEFMDEELKSFMKKEGNVSVNNFSVARLEEVC